MQTHGMVLFREQARKCLTVRGRLIRYGTGLITQNNAGSNPAPATERFLRGRQYDLV